MEKLLNQIYTAKYSPVAGTTLHTAHYTLHTRHCTLHTAPEHEHAPLPAHVHFILQTEHYTLHTTCLCCLLHIYHFTLQTSKICLSGNQDLHGKMNLNIRLWKCLANSFVPGALTNVSVLFKPSPTIKQPQSLP